MMASALRSSSLQPRRRATGVSSSTSSSIDSRTGWSRPWSSRMISASSPYRAARHLFSRMIQLLDRQRVAAVHQGVQPVDQALAHGRHGRDLPHRRQAVADAQLDRAEAGVGRMSHQTSRIVWIVLAEIKVSMNCSNWSQPESW